MEEEIDPKIELIKKQERKKALLGLPVSILVTLIGSVYVYRLLQVDPDKWGTFGLRSFGHDFAFALLLVLGGLTGIVYYILLRIRNKKHPQFDYMDPQVLKKASEELNVIEEQLDSDTPKSRDSKGDDEDESSNHGSRVQRLNRRR